MDRKKSGGKGSETKTHGEMSEMSTLDPPLMSVISTIPHPTASKSHPLSSHAIAAEKEPEEVKSVGLSWWMKFCEMTGCAERIFSAKRGVKRGERRKERTFP